MNLKIQLQNKINQKTKPVGALGKLETLALQIGLIFETLTPEIHAPTILIFAADHGISESGVSAYPSSVTAQMVLNFLNGGAAINVFARQHHLNLKIIDAGVNADFLPHENLLNAKIARGTQNFLNAPAMTLIECENALTTGAAIVQQQYQGGCNCIGFGEMGIGNTASAAVLMHLFTQIPLAECVGRGTGLNDEQLANKRNLLKQAIEKYPDLKKPLEILATFGGFEIAMMAGAYLKAAELKMLILVDGFLCGAALLVAQQFAPHVLDYCVFSHVGSENGHRALLNYLNAKPLLDLEMRLGEGSGIALAFPLIQSAILFLNEMATFEEAGVDEA
ncbi:MAG: nicotinate-nucleotide--dimethylbenzimidazole phosphoribosyltransferase [Methylococcaceae bacterium]